MRKIPNKNYFKKSNKYEKKKKNHPGNPGHNEKTKPKDNWYR